MTTATCGPQCVTDLPHSLIQSFGSPYAGVTMAGSTPRAPQTPGFRARWVPPHRLADRAGGSPYPSMERRGHPMYRFIVRAAAAAAAGCTVFYVMALIGVAIDPTGIAMSRRLGTILLAVIIVCALVAIHGWQVEAATRRAAAEAAQRTAAAVSTAVLG